MTGNVALDVVIGLVFIYSLYSLLTTTLVELIATYFQLRARNLAKGIRRMLNDNGKEVLAQKFYDTPLIKYMASGLWRMYNKPSYLQSRNFSKALIHILRNDASSGATPVEKIKSALKSYENTQTGKFLADLLEDAENDIQKFNDALETWFNDTMERASGWYKRKITAITFLVGFVVATAFNVDSLQIVRKLSQDPKVREQYISVASQFITEKTMMETTYDPRLAGRLKADSVIIHRFKGDTKAISLFVDDSVKKALECKRKILVDRLKTLNSYSQQTQHILYFKRVSDKGFIFDSWNNLLGCFATALALSLGAPFWFDLLKRIMNIRGSIVKLVNGETSSEKSKSSIVK